MQRPHLGYTFTLLVLAVLSGMVAVAAWAESRWLAAVCGYVSVSLGLLATAYAGAGPSLLLKRPTGYHAPLAWMLFAPYFLFSRVMAWAYRRLSREPAYAQVVPNLFFGRRLTLREGMATGWDAVLDLAVELPAAWVPSRYYSLPVLDGTAPTAEQLHQAVVWIAEALPAGPVYVHCALGHGRSACVVIAYLLSTGRLRDSGRRRPAAADVTASGTPGSGPTKTVPQLDAACSLSQDHGRRTRCPSGTAGSLTSFPCRRCRSKRPHRVIDPQAFCSTDSVSTRRVGPGTHGLRTRRTIIACSALIPPW